MKAQKSESVESFLSERKITDAIIARGTPNESVIGPPMDRFVVNLTGARVSELEEGTEYTVIHVFELTDEQYKRLGGQQPEPTPPRPD